MAAKKGERISRQAPRRRGARKIPELRRERLVELCHRVDPEWNLEDLLDDFKSFWKIPRKEKPSVSTIRRWARAGESGTDMPGRFLHLFTLYFNQRIPGLALTHEDWYTT